MLVIHLIKQKEFQNSLQFSSIVIRKATLFACFIIMYVHIFLVALWVATLIESCKNLEFENLAKKTLKNLEFGKLKKKNWKNLEF